MTFLRIFGGWIRFNGTEVEAVEESAHYKKTSRKQRDPIRTAIVVPYMTDN
jgi:hypothetical protein